MKKIELRPWKAGDADKLAVLADDFSTWIQVRDHFPHPYTLEDAKAYLEYAMSKPTPEDFAILIDGEIAGGTGFVPLNDVHRMSAEIGYWVAQPFRGQGVATETALLVCDYVFANTGIIHLQAGVFSTNPASMRVLEKAGFSKVGIMHRCAIKNGQIIDLHYYEKSKP